MKKIPKISKENFSATINYAYLLNRKMTANISLQNIILPIGSILFAINTFICLLGIAQIIVADNNGNIPFIVKFDFLSDFIESVWNRFGITSEHLILKCIIFFLLLYLIPIIVCGVVRFIVSFFIKEQSPKPKLVGTYAQQAKQLYEYVEKCPFHKISTYSAETIWCRISGIPVLIGFAAIVTHALYANQKVNNSDIWSHIFLLVIIILEVILLYLLYTRLYLLLTFFIKPFYDSRKEWETFKKEAENYWVSIDKHENIKRTKEKKESYDGWKYKRLEKTLYYKDKFDEHYAKYMGQPYETDAEKAERQVKEIEEELSGGGWGDY